MHRHKTFLNTTRKKNKVTFKFCELCQRKGSTVKKGLVVKPIYSSEMNTRSLIDFFGMQAHPNGNYTFICVFQNHFTTFVILKPLRHKSTGAAANVLLDLFTLFGAPTILQSDNWREFVNKIKSEHCSLWKNLKTVHGKPRHSQSQGSVEWGNQDVKNMLATSLQDNKTKKNGAIA